MVTRTFISKSTTIFNGSKDNFGLNPIGMLNYGETVSRCLLYFDIDNITKGLNNGLTRENTRHYLKLTNCGSLFPDDISEMVPDSASVQGEKERACSFDIIVFRIPEPWDAGKGFDNSTDFWFIGKKAVSQHGANWYYAYDGKKWGTVINESGTTNEETGVYSLEFLEEEYEKFLKGEESVIITKQHFDRGNENFNLDITDFVNGVLDEEYLNYGVCLAFAPNYESMKPDYTQYVGFFTENTNTLFHPVVESRCTDKVSDSRYTFYVGKENRLYFYSVLGGSLTDLDELPTCTIDDVEYPVTRQSEGVYYATVKIGKNEVEKNKILYDIWGNLKYDGDEFDDVEMEFVAHSKDSFFQLGEAAAKKIQFEPSITGINDNEKIYQGAIRELKVQFKIKFTPDYELIEDSYYRIYVKDGRREIDIIDWDNINIMGIDNVFMLDTTTLIPQEYHIDIKAKYGKETRIFKNKATFKIVDNATEMKR